MASTTWQRITRMVRHAWLDASDAERRLGAAAMKTLQQRVVESERHHSGEIRVCVEAGLPWSYLRRGATARERAVALFGKLRVWDTADNNGVLIYLLLADHRIEIVADRGLNDRVPASHWTAITTAMADAFRAGHFADGLDLAVDAVHQVLVQHHPVPAGARNVNELPDAVVVL